MRVVAVDGGLAAGRALPGRGAWLCQDSPTGVEAAVRRGGLGRALRTAVGPEAVEALRGQIEKR